MRNIIKYIVIFLLYSHDVKATIDDTECKFFTSGALGSSGYGSEVLRTYREDMTLWFWSAHDKFGVRLYFSVDEDGSFDDYFWFAVTQKNTWHNISLLQGGPWDARLVIPFAGVDKTLKRRRYYNMKVDSDNYILWSRCHPKNLGVLEDCESTLLSTSTTDEPAVADEPTGNKAAAGSDHESRLRQNSILTFLSGPDEVWWASVLLLVLASLLGVCILLIVFLIIRASDANKKYKLLLQGSGTDSDLQTYCSSQDSEMYVKTNSNKQNGKDNASSKGDPFAETQKQLKDICAVSRSSSEMFIPATSSPHPSANFPRDKTHMSTRSVGGYSRVHSTTSSNNIYSQHPKDLVRLAKLSRSNSKLSSTNSKPSRINSPKN